MNTGGSLTWTRTKNLPVNSRLLCQLSYQGLLAIRDELYLKGPERKKRAPELEGNPLRHKSPSAQVPGGQLLLYSSLGLEPHQAGKCLPVQLLIFQGI